MIIYLVTEVENPRAHVSYARALPLSSIVILFPAFVNRFMLCTPMIFICAK